MTSPLYANHLPKEFTDLVLTPTQWVNAHCHLDLWTDSPVPRAEKNGKREGMGDWALKMAQWQRQLTFEQRLENCRHSLHALFELGCAFVHDNSYDGASLAVLAEMNMPAVVYLEFFHPWESLNWPVIEAFCERYQQLALQWQDHAFLKLGIAPHSPYNVQPQALAEVIERLNPHYIQLHVSESEDEQAWCKTPWLPNSIHTLHQTILGQMFYPAYPGKSAIRQLLPLIQETCTSIEWYLIHGCYLTLGELNLLAELPVTLVHCPDSNAFLQHRPLNTHHCQQAGVTLAYGTDGKCSVPQFYAPSDVR